MLETKGLTKIYKPKKGVPVKALDGVNLKFPDKGMVFLLGKSGSGKSSLLNVLGGLDRYNQGEIIIKGVSSKKFKQKHFDSYRNTYVGFIFQEYNILDEFSVGANIALAIQLQGRKATEQEINDILNKVDLAGYGKRKPNELSGGQKQRVAIARALVKNPQIIMADEPTGALDSNTGRAILDTLKKLSKEKLVIVVSHDREFAENYADRIIELSDGRVISDVEVVGENAELLNEGLVYNGDTIQIPEKYTLTEEDLLAINNYIKNFSGGARLKLSSTKSKRRFAPTNVSGIVQNAVDSFKLIKSHLPLKNAFKMGASGLKHKKIRLVVTILLSCISFGLFGLADTFAAYNHIESCTNSLVDSNIDYVSTVKACWIQEDEDFGYWQDYDLFLSDSEVEKISQNLGVKMHGVFCDGDMGIYNQLGYRMINGGMGLSQTYDSMMTGFTEINDSILKEMGYTVLAGTLPKSGTNEIAISEFILKLFQEAGYKTYSEIFDMEAEVDIVSIKTAEDLIGKTLHLAGNDYKISAVIDTKFDLERYSSLFENPAYDSNADTLVRIILQREFEYAIKYSYTNLAMIGEGGIDKILSDYYDTYYGESEDYPDEEYGNSFPIDIHVTSIESHAELYEKFPQQDDIRVHKYSFCVGAMPKDKSEIRNIVEYCNKEEDGVRYQMMNSVTFELDSINELLQELSIVFLYIGLSFLLFASLMLANFISTSISYKKQEIGILRAIGSRSNDVFKIFFCESFIIAMINFVLSATGVGLATWLINYLIRTEAGILITIISFGPRQILLLFAVSLLVAFISSYLPVKKIASKRPIDAIRNR